MPKANAAELLGSSEGGDSIVSSPHPSPYVLDELEEWDETVMDIVKQARVVVLRGGGLRRQTFSYSARVKDYSGEIWGLCVCH